MSKRKNGGNGILKDNALFLLKRVRDNFQDSAHRFDPNFRIKYGCGNEVGIPIIGGSMRLPRDHALIVTETRLSGGYAYFVSHLKRSDYDGNWEYYKIVAFGSKDKSDEHDGHNGNGRLKRGHGRRYS